METMTGLFPEEIVEVFHIEPSFRGGQIFSWIHRGAGSYDEMSNLPKLLKEELNNKTTLYSTRLESKHPDPDGTVKLRIRTGDNLTVEAVILKDRENRLTACLSSQAGCAMGCRFCRTGEMGLRRNLTAGEMVEQFLWMERESGEISNIVFMGMGEPLANYEAFVKAVKILSHPKGRDMGIRRMTVSTCGLVPEIRRLGQEGPPLRLAISLNSARQTIRENIMPIARKYPLDELKEVLMEYQERQSKRITLEYVLLKGINDSMKDLEALVSWTKDLRAVVNLIPWNPVESLDFQTAPEETTRLFQTSLESAGITVTRRYRRGRGVNGACGQLGDLG
jgi:23S rRNA (adenine2503-C2)-methyltransferase